MAFYKENNLMSEIIDDGGTPPVVGSDAKPVFLPHRKWEKDEVIGLIEGVLGIDCSDITGISVGEGCGSTFQLEGCDVADGPEWQVWNTKNYWLDIDHDPMIFNQDELGCVLSNYEHGGLKSVRAYLDYMNKVNIA